MRFPHPVLLRSTLKGGGAEGTEGTGSKTEGIGEEHGEEKRGEGEDEVGEEVRVCVPEPPKFESYREKERRWWDRMVATGQV